MGTQAILSLVDPHGRVVRKVVVGDNGFNISKLAEALAGEGDPVSHPDLFKLARRKKFGCSECIIIQGPRSEDCYYGGEMIDPDLISPLFREKYDDPRFNPRWARGTADHVRVVNVPWSDRS